MGARIKRLRAEHGMTQRELAKAARVTQGLISQVESGTTKTMTAEVAVRIARALGTTVEALVK